MIKKKYRWKDPKIAEILISKQFEFAGYSKHNLYHGIDYNYIKENQHKIKEEHGMEWYQYYVFHTPEEFQAWKDFCIDFMLNNITPKPTLERVQTEWQWLNLSFGLKQAYLHDKQTVNNTTPIKVSIYTNVKEFIKKFFKFN